MNLSDRVSRLEQILDANKPRRPGLVYLSAFESRDDAMVRYKKHYGCDPERIVEIRSVDCSRE